MLSSVNGKTEFAEGKKTLTVFAKMSDRVILVEGASVRWHLDCTAIHFDFKI